MKCDIKFVNKVDGGCWSGTLCRGSHTQTSVEAITSGKNIILRTLMMSQAIQMYAEPHVNHGKWDCVTPRVEDWEFIAPGSWQHY